LKWFVDYLGAPPPEEEYFLHVKGETIRKFVHDPDEYIAFTGLAHSARAFTNNHGTDIGRNYLTGERLSGAMPDACQPPFEI
jgi:hypothetical protein